MNNQLDLVNELFLFNNFFMDLVTDFCSTKVFMDLVMKMDFFFFFSNCIKYGFECFNNYIVYNVLTTTKFLLFFHSRLLRFLIRFESVNLDTIIPGLFFMLFTKMIVFCYWFSYG